MLCVHDYLNISVGNRILCKELVLRKVPSQILGYVSTWRTGVPYPRSSATLGLETLFQNVWTRTVVAKCKKETYCFGLAEYCVMTVLWS